MDVEKIIHMIGNVLTAFFIFFIFVWIFIVYPEKTLFMYKLLNLIIYSISIWLMVFVVKWTFIWVIKVFKK